MAQEIKQEENDLLNFNWESSSEDAFFGMAETKPANPEPEKKKEDKPNPDPKDKEEEKEEEEDDFFEEEGDTGITKVKEEDKTDTKKSPKSEDTFYKDVYKDLKETGVLKHVEIEEDEEIDADRLAELQDEDYELEVSQRLTNWATKDLDEDARAFIKFKREGGNTVDFFKAYSTATALPNGNITDEDYQDEVIRYQLTQEGWDRDEIEDRIAYLTENNRKEKIAKKYDEKIKEADQKNKQALLAQTESNKAKAKEQEEEFKETIKETLEETKEINGFKFTPQDKAKVYDFLTKKQHKVSDTKAITGFQKKLAETFQDPEKMVLLAKLIESDFDMTSFEKATVTKKTKEVKSNLEQRRNLRPAGSGSSSTGGEGLAALFN